MPKAPTKTNLTANSAQILNAIHDSATETEVWFLEQTAKILLLLKRLAIS